MSVSYFCQKVVRYALLFWLPFYISKACLIPAGCLRRGRFKRRMRAKANVWAERRTFRLFRPEEMSEGPFISPMQPQHVHQPFASRGVVF